MGDQRILVILGKCSRFTKYTCKLLRRNVTHVFAGEKCLAGLDGLPTPDNTPTKNQDKKDGCRVDDVKFSPPTHRRMSKSHSESRLDSPRPTEAKLPKCINGDKCTGLVNCSNGDCTADTKPKLEEGKLPPVTRARGRQRKGVKTKRGGTLEKSSRNRPKSAPPNK